MSIPSLDSKTQLPITGLERGRLVEFGVLPQVERPLSIVAVLCDNASVLDNVASIVREKMMVQSRDSWKDFRFKLSTAFNLLTPAARWQNSAVRLNDVKK